VELLTLRWVGPIYSGLLEHWHCTWKCYCGVLSAILHILLLEHWHCRTTDSNKATSNEPWSSIQVEWTWTSGISVCSFKCLQNTETIRKWGSRNHYVIRW
jgi:hypothetical protein